MQTVRYSEARGHANLGWLDSKHTFSFGHYYDPEHVSFGALRVINEDRVAPGAGFDTHGHADMEIISYVLDGALEHRDSLGNGFVLRPGEIQRMTAGTGVRHSEFNHSQVEPVHFLQIWIIPSEDGLEPSYEQKALPPLDGNGLTLIGSRSGRDESVTIHQDVDLYRGALEGDGQITFNVRSGRKVWVQIIRGEVACSGEVLRAGDAIGVTDEGALVLKGVTGTEFLLFDLKA